MAPPTQVRVATQIATQQIEPPRAPPPEQPEAVSPIQRCASRDSATTTPKLHAVVRSRWTPINLQTLYGKSYAHVYGFSAALSEHTFKNQAIDGGQAYYLGDRAYAMVYEFNSRTGGSVLHHRIGQRWPVVGYYGPGSGSARSMSVTPHGELAMVDAESTDHAASIFGAPVGRKGKLKGLPKLPDDFQLIETEYDERPLHAASDGSLFALSAPNEQGFRIVHWTKKGVEWSTAPKAKSLTFIAPTVLASTDMSGKLTFLRYHDANWIADTCTPQVNPASIVSDGDGTLYATQLEGLLGDEVVTVWASASGQPWDRVAEFVPPKEGHECTELNGVARVGKTLWMSAECSGPRSHQYLFTTGMPAPRKIELHGASLGSDEENEAQ